MPPAALADDFRNTFRPCIGDLPAEYRHLAEQCLSWYRAALGDRAQFLSRRITDGPLHFHQIAVVCARRYAQLAFDVEGRSGAIDGKALAGEGACHRMGQAGAVETWRDADRVETNLSANGEIAHARIAAAQQRGYSRSRGGGENAAIGPVVPPGRQWQAYFSNRLSLGTGDPPDEGAGLVAPLNVAFQLEKAGFAGLGGGGDILAIERGDHGLGQAGQAFDRTHVDRNEGTGIDQLGAIALMLERPGQGGAGGGRQERNPDGQTGRR